MSLCKKALGRVARVAPFVFVGGSCLAVGILTSAGLEVVSAMPPALRLTAGLGAGAAVLAGCVWLAARHFGGEE